MVHIAADYTQRIMRSAHLDSKAVKCS